MGRPACWRPSSASKRPIRRATPTTTFESSNPANTPRYERLGFKVCGEFELPEDGPSVTQMWRDPA